MLAKDLQLSQETEPTLTSYLSIVLTANRLQEAIRHTMKPFGFQPGPYNVLRILRGAGKDGLSCGAIGARLLDPTPDVTRLLARLEDRGYVRRARDPEDKRSIKAYITDQGKTAMAPLDKKLIDIQEELLGIYHRPCINHWSRPVMLFVIRI